MRERGTVKWFNAAKGYGFVRRANGEDLFVHYSAIQAPGYRTLETDESVEFELKRGDKGSYAANLVQTSRVGSSAIVSRRQSIGAEKACGPCQTAPAERVTKRQIWRHIRINELARECEQHNSAILAILPEYGVIEKKTHSSSVRVEVANRIRRHFGVSVEPEIVLPDHEVVEVTIDFQRLLNELAARRANLLELTPQQFEELIAEIWDRFGYKVELTKRTRDGGYDVVAVGRKEVDLKFLIECKRYDPRHRIDVSLVRALHGVLAHERATKAILATTSYFTEDAKHLLEDHRWELEGRDHDGVLDWAAEAARIVRKPAGLIWVPGEC